MNNLRCFFTLTTLIFISPLCPHPTAGEPTVVRFGVCLSTTGELSPAGLKALAGIKLRMKEFNARSAETGLKLDMVLRDDESWPQNAADIVRELATVEKVPAIIGPLSTNLMLAMCDFAREQEVVLISPSVTSPKIGRNGDWCFRLLFDDEFQGVALARFIRGKLGLGRAAAIINNRFTYADSVFSSFKRVFEEEGGEIVAEERYDWVADEDRMYDFSAILERIAEVKPDIVLLPVYSTEVAAIIRESLRAGVGARFCGGDTWQHENVLLSSGNNLEDSYFIGGIDFESGSPSMERFLRLFDQSHDPDAQPMSVLGYDALSLLIKALENGHDSRSVKEGLYRIRDFEIATGTITIDPGRGSEKSAFIHRINMVDNQFVSTNIDEIKP